MDLGSEGKRYETTSVRGGAGNNNLVVEGTGLGNCTSPRELSNQQVWRRRAGNCTAWAKERGLELSLAVSRKDGVQYPQRHGPCANETPALGDTTQLSQWDESKMSFEHGSWSTMCRPPRFRACSPL